MNRSDQPSFSHGPGPRWQDPDSEERGWGRALAGGFVAAAVGGVLWAGVVLYANLEVGWIAWGVGLLVGATIARLTEERSFALGAWAAGIATVGLLIGKLLITMGSTGALASQLAGDDDLFRATVAWQMYAEDELSPEIREELDALSAAGDTIPDALWERMLEEATPGASQLTDEQRQDIAQSQARLMIGDLGVVRGIMVQLGPWDLLWFGLAIVTAFQMVAQRKEEEIEAARPDEDAA